MIRVICVNNSNVDYRLAVNKKYNAIKSSNDFLYHIFDDFNNRLGLFPCHLFKTKVNYREERLNDIL